MTAHEIETSEDRQRAIIDRREREANAVEMAELRQNADRYLWMKANLFEVDGMIRALWRGHPTFDAAIDAAIKAGK